MIVFHTIALVIVMTARHDFVDNMTATVTCKRN